MPDNMPVDGEVIQRALRTIDSRWFKNGVDEFCLGLFASLIGAWYFRDLPVNGWLFLPVPICAAAVLCVRQWLVKSVVTPRSGYVVFRFPKKVAFAMSAALLVMVAAEVAIAVIWYVYDLPKMTHLLGPAAALVMAIIFGAIGFRFHLSRWRWYAALTLLFGAVTFAVGTGGEGIAWVFWGIGVMLALSGAQQMAGFMKAHQIAEDHCG